MLKFWGEIRFVAIMIIAIISDLHLGRKLITEENRRSRYLGDVAWIGRGNEFSTSM